MGPFFKLIITTLLICSTTPRQCKGKRISFETYPTLDSIVSYMRDIANEYPGLVNLQSIGKSQENRDIYLINIGNSKGRRNAVWIDAGIHAREWISPTTAIYIIDKLVAEFSGQGSPKSPFVNVDWMIIPVANPDGYQYSHETDRYWRKNRSPPPPGFNCSGVDLNRNFLVPSPHGEKGFGVGASNNPCLEFYKGPRENSEPETQALVSAFNAHLSNITTALSLHNFGQYLTTPWAYTHKPSPHKRRLDAWAARVISAIESVHNTYFRHRTVSKGLNRLGGTTKDFYHASGVVFVATIELRDQGRFKFYLPEDQIVPVGEETWAGMEEVAKTAATPDDY